MTLTDFLGRLQGVRQHGDQYEARCPAHEDQKASLSVSTGRNQKILLRCHAGCSFESILAALHLEARDLMGDNGTGHAPSSKLGDLVATYDYRDEVGRLVHQVCRYVPKDFCQRRPDGAGGWIWKMGGVRRVAYHLDALQGKAAAFVVEGEKDADRLWALGLPATCNAEGAGRWTADHAAQLKAAGVQRVAVLPDHDQPGQDHAAQVARTCRAAGLEARVVPLPDVPDKGGDVSDYLDAGHSKDDLLALVKATPLWQPPPVGADLGLVHLGDLLSEPDELHEWLVENLIPSGGVCVLAAKPKVGKSTLARHLALCVARGQPFLGRRTQPGTVVYLAFEEKRAEVRRHFRRMGATGREPICLIINDPPQDAIAKLGQLAADAPIALIGVDTLQRLLRVTDINDYAEITTAMAPILQLARQSGAAILLLHHANKVQSLDAIDSVLGSTALSGSVDNVFFYARREQVRILSSQQRIGQDLEPTVITLDECGRSQAAGPKYQVDLARVKAALLNVLTGCLLPVAADGWLLDQIEASHSLKRAALRDLVREGLIRQTGKGTRGDPCLYSRRETPSDPIPAATPRRESEKPSGRGDSRPAPLNSEGENPESVVTVSDHETNSRRETGVWSGDHEDPETSRRESSEAPYEHF